MPLCLFIHKDRTKPPICLTIYKFLHNLSLNCTEIYACRYLNNCFYIISLYNPEFLIYLHKR